MTNENPYKVGDKVEVTSTDYSSVRSGKVCRVDQVMTTDVRYCVWVSFVDGYPSGNDWPFALDEIKPYSPTEGSV